MNFDAQEEFSYAYIHAIAAGAGCSCQVAPRPLDNSGIDMTLHANGKKGSYKARPLYLQVKSSYQNRYLNRTDYINYADLDFRDYNSLASDETYANPYIFVLILVPQNQAEWVSQSEKELCLRYSAYWLSLKGETPITKNKGIKIPISQKLTVNALQDIMERIRQGGSP
jgi:hypothetical protein